MKRRDVLKLLAGAPIAAVVTPQIAAAATPCKHWFATPYYAPVDLPYMDDREIARRVADRAVSERYAMDDRAKWVGPSFCVNCGITRDT